MNTACILVDKLYNNTNIMVSPLSIYLALGMAANGASKETLKEFENFFDCSLDELNTMAKNITNNNDNVLSTANGIWVKEDPSIKLKEEYINKIKEFYNGKIKLAPMNFNTVGEINEFVKENTHDMIPNIINELPDTIISVLVNALYFEALWSKPYKDFQIKDGIFNNKYDVKYLTETGKSYMENEKATGFKKYYKEGNYSFIAILPKKMVNLIYLI